MNLIDIVLLFSGTDSCNSNCHCDYVKYSPVCGSDNFTYISACHAGCKIIRKDNGSEVRHEILSKCKYTYFIELTHRSSKIVRAFRC